MFTVSSLSLAISFCVVTMLGWGSLGEHPEAGRQDQMAVRAVLLGLCPGSIPVIDPVDVHARKYRRRGHGSGR